VVGALRARHVELFGEARDTVVVSERLVIRSTGRADGQITYGEIEVERGAQLKGSLTCTRHGGADSAPKPGSAKSGSGAGTPPKG
jgi:cytoskeletal protein CcmA (bactofilin family)